MSTRQYSSDQVAISWAGLDFQGGLAQGSFVTEARTAGSWTQRATLSGGTIRSYNADRTGTVTVLINRESQLMVDLLVKAAEDRLNRDVVKPMVVKDVSSGRTMTYVNAYIMTDPDEVWATEGQDISWVFAWEKITKQAPAGSVPNIVGS